MSGRPGHVVLVLLGGFLVVASASASTMALMAPLAVLLGAFCLDLGRVARRLAR